MDISAISSIMSSSATGLIQQLRSTASSLLSGVANGISDTGSSTTKISKTADLLSRLQKLKDENPEEFKKLMTGIADKLNAAAKAQGDTQEGKLLSGLAQKFQDVANGADLSELAPTKLLSSLGAAKQASGIGSLISYERSHQTERHHRSHNGVDSAALRDALQSIFSDLSAALPA
ncbi:MAG: hypothetical protein NTX50_23375 [Candidatus Sumerlaeota bacterium]|nr:hypothetical protein [Candidatus Sumerlaeota bacterium]